MNLSSNTDDPPVTISVSRRIKPGFEAAFEELLIGIIQAAMSFKGHLGVNVFRPSNPSDPEYRMIFKFDRMSNLRRWEESEIRHQWLIRAESLTLGLPETQTLTGLESWFTLPAQRTIVPPASLQNHIAHLASDLSTHHRVARSAWACFSQLVAFGATDAGPDSSAGTADDLCRNAMDDSIVCLVAVPARKLLKSL